MTLALPFLLVVAGQVWFVVGQRLAAAPMIRACDQAEIGMRELEFHQILQDAEPEFISDTRDSHPGAGDAARGPSDDGTYRLTGFRTFVFYRAVCGATFDERGLLTDRRFHAFD